jgi:hypothetical protein
MPNYSDEQMRNLLANAQKGVFADDVFQRAEKDDKEFEFKGRTGDALREIMKRTHKELPQPGYDEKQEVLREFRAYKKSQEDKEEAAKKKAEDDDWAAERKAVQQQNKLTDEQMDAVWEHMKKRHIGNWEDGAAAWQAKQPRMTEPSDGRGGMFMNYQKMDEWEEVGKDPNRYLERVVGSVAQQLEDQDKRSRYGR